MGDREYVELAPGSTLGSVVDLSVFGGFQPDRTFEDVERSHGLPDSVRRRHANTYYSYRVEGARVELARLLIQSEGSEVIKWELKAFPETPQPLSRYVDPSVLKQTRNGSSGITIMTSGSTESASFQVKRGTVVSIYWMGSEPIQG